MAHFICFVMFVALALATPPATACGPEGCPLGGCSSAAESGVFGLQGNYYFTALLHAKKLDLSAAQVADLKGRYQAQRQTEAAIEQRLDAARTRLQAAITGAPGNEAQVQAILNEMRDLTAELRARVVESAEAGQKLLTEAQRARLWALVSGAPVATATTPEPPAAPES